MGFATTFDQGAGGSDDKPGCRGSLATLIRYSRPSTVNPPYPLKNDSVSPGDSARDARDGRGRSAAVHVVRGASEGGGAGGTMGRRSCTSSAPREPSIMARATA